MTTLTEKASKGNLNAMQEVYRRYRQKIFYLIRTLLQDSDTAERTTTKVFGEIWGKLQEMRLSSDEEFGAYLLTYAARSCYRTRFSKEERVIRQGVCHTGDYPKGYKDFDGNIKLSWPYFEMAVRNFEPHRYFVVILHLAGFDAKDIAAVTGMKQKNAEVFLDESLYKLHKELSLLRDDGRTGVPQLEELNSLYSQMAEKSLVPAPVDVKIYQTIENSAKPKNFSTGVVAAAIVLFVAVVAGGIWFVDRYGSEDETAEDPDTEVSVTVEETSEDETLEDTESEN